MNQPIRPWKVLSTRYLKSNIRVDRCETSSGKILEPVILEYGTWVSIVALTKQQEVLLIRQYRHGLGKIIWEIPGGCVEDGEEPLAAARRELLEETGYTSDRIIAIGKVSPNPSNHTNLMHAYLALDARKVSDQSLDETEEIEVFPIPLADAILMARNGEFLQALHLSAFFFALCYLERVIQISQK